MMQHLGTHHEELRRAGHARRRLLALNTEADLLRLIAYAETYPKGEPPTSIPGGREVADALAKIEDPAARVSVAFKLFGAEGVSMLQLLEGGSAPIAELTRQFEQLGGVIGEQAARDAEAFLDEMTNLMVVVRSVRNALGSALLPIIQPLIVAFREWLAVNRELISAKIEEWVTGFARVLPQIIADLQAVGRVLAWVWGWLWSAIEQIGGLKTVLLTLAALLAGRLLLAVLATTKAILGLAWAIGVTLARGAVLASARIVRWAPLLSGMLVKALRAAARAVLATTKAILGLVWAIGAKLARGAVLAASGIARLAPLLGGMLVKALGAAAWAVRGLGLALMTTPVGWIIGAIAAIAVAAYLIYRYWEPISAFFESLWSDIRAAFERGFLHGIVHLLRTFSPVALVTAGMTALIRYLAGLPFVQIAVGWVADLARPLTQWAPARIALGWMASLAGGIGDGIADVVSAAQGLADGLVGTLGGAWDRMRAAGLAVKATILGIVAEIAGKIAGLTERLPQWAQAGIGVDGLGDFAAQAAAARDETQAQRERLNSEALGSRSEAVTREERRESVDVNLRIDSEGRPRVRDMRSSSDRVGVTVDSGLVMVGG